MDGRAASAGTIALPEALLNALRCPRCLGTVDGSTNFECSECDLSYRAVDGIPIFTASGADVPAGAEHKRGQAEFFDVEASPEWEVTRPHGAPAWHAWQLEEKQRRGTSGLGPLTGMSALTVCGGSGMDAEHLARLGAAPVVSTDLSLGAAQRVVERARRFAVPLTAMVADVERLPLEDRSFDLVFVHDGLHHLENPALGLREMARVARRAVSVNEPARANATRMAIKTGISVEYEEAGNRVARMTIAEIEDVLGEFGFETVVAERYAMLYRHEPGMPTRFLSRPGVNAIARGGWRAGNALIGHFGNKLTVQAVRRQAS
jgi:ubiquinone/menaquinone biosynthesis C-methylase UbiE